MSLLAAKITYYRHFTKIYPDFHLVHRNVIIYYIPQFNVHCHSSYICYSFLAAHLSSVY